MSAPRECCIAGAYGQSWPCRSAWLVAFGAGSLVELEWLDEVVACSRGCFVKGVLSGAFKTVLVCLRTSLRAGVSRGFCCRRTFGIGCRAIIWRGL